MLLGYGQRSGFPAEIILEICLLVTPIDLLKLYYTCRYFKTFLGLRPWVWRRARQRFLPPIPDPVLPPDPTANWSEVAYISLIFGGGKCSICHVPVQTLPNSFAMKERRCKKLACITRWKYNHCRMVMPDKENPRPDRIHWLDFPLWVPFLESSLIFEEEPIYTRSAIWKAQEELTVASELSRGYVRKRPTPYTRNLDELEKSIARRMGWMDAIMTTAMALWPWAGGYNRERRQTKQLNRQWILSISQAEKIRPCILLQSSTLANVIERFSDAQSVVTLTVWRSIRPTVLREVAQYRAGMRALPLHKNCTDVVQCPFCPRSTYPKMFKGGMALETHVRQKHPDRNHLEIVKKSRSR